MIGTTPDALVSGRILLGLWLDEVKIFHTTRGQRKHEISFFYSKMPTLRWDPGHWRWPHAWHFLDYTTKFARELVINQTLGTTRVANNWQSYLPRNGLFIDEAKWCAWVTMKLNPLYIRFLHSNTNVYVLIVG